MKRHQASRIPSSDKIFTGAALVAVAIGMSGALHSPQARAETVPAAGITSAEIPVLPTLRVVAAADTTATDAASTREGVRERMNHRIEDHAEAHPPIDKHLTSEQVRDIVAGRIAMSGNSNLKVGKVTAKADGIVAVDVVTKTGALVETHEISTKTGLSAKMEKAMSEHRGFGRGHGRMREPAMGRRGGHRGTKGGMDSGDHERDLALTVAQAKKLAEARLIMMGNPNLKVGAVKEKDADTITVDIVAADNSLVSQHVIDRHTGRRQKG
ncbi:MAG: hypothetical protein K2P94_13505 [Rhodospirillaceae bacterium]|nr:hypothetical protein [Rhodospirillaceae bacterium]